MAGHRLSGGHPAPLARYLAELSGPLPADVVEELGDGLADTWRHYRELGLSPAAAADAAIADFGTPGQTIAAFVAHSPGRRLARTLLATGPVMAVCWGSALIAAHAWDWPVTAAAKAAFAVTLLAVVAVLVAAATSRYSLGRTRLAAAGALGLLVLDAAMLAAAVLIAPALAWPMAAAIAASLARIALTLRALPTALAR
ncbi:MAG TPA: hypothetical protein VFU43_27240 [Streptosporangiaceae bacterium]|nr:hypothetical protein [Streptosporangiaceae bacterium]